MPLDYILTADSPTLPMTSFMDSITDHELIYEFFCNTPMERCRVVEVREGRSDVISHIRELSDSLKPLPHLERLTLHTWSWNWEGARARLFAQGMDTFAISAPNCTHVHLHNAFTTIRSRSLLSFTLRFDSESPRPTFRVLYRMMSAFDANILQHIELAYAASDLDLPGVQTPCLPPIELPNLRSLRVEGSTSFVTTVLRTLAWSRRDIRLRVKAWTVNGPEDCLNDQHQVLRLCYPRRHETLGVHVGHVDEYAHAQQTSVCTWSETPSGDLKPDRSITFSGALNPCPWHSTAAAAISICGPEEVIAFSLSLTEADWKERTIPWDTLLTSLPKLYFLHPFDRIQAHVGPIPDTHVLATIFRSCAPPL
ncbi:hypothetical protein PENSPDRAFT_695566 [Peniophora sp. CONT]|nr:hypothetical protein PENSPDRAFT_695566 [Peniophora sp. CONT]